MHFFKGSVGHNLPCFSSEIKYDNTNSNLFMDDEPIVFIDNFMIVTLIAAEQGQFF